jgi:hypothetical protein
LIVACRFEERREMSVNNVPAMAPSRFALATNLQALSAPRISYFLRRQQNIV